MSMSLSMSLSLGGPTATPAAPAPGGLLFEADFQTATYAIAGVAGVLSDILVENLDWGTFVPASVIDAAGLNFAISTDCLPVFAPAFSSAAGGAGITLVGALNVGDAATSGMFAELNDAPTYSQENSFEISRDTTKVNDLGGSDTQAGPGLGVCTFAANVGPDRIAISINGGAVLARTVPTATFTLLCLGTPSTATVSSLRTLNGRAIVAEADLPSLSV